MTPSNLMRSFLIARDSLTTGDVPSSMAGLFTARISNYFWGVSPSRGGFASSYNHAPTETHSKKKPQGWFIIPTNMLTIYKWWNYTAKSPKAPDPPSRDSGQIIVEASPHGTAPPRSSSRFVSLERSCPLPYEDHLVLSPTVFSVGGTVFLLIFVTIQLLPTTLYNQNTYFLHLDMPRCTEYTRRMEMQSRVDMMGHGWVVSGKKKLHLVRIMNMYKPARNNINWGTYTGTTWVENVNGESPGTNDQGPQLTQNALRFSWPYPVCWIEHGNAWQPLGPTKNDRFY